MRAAIGYHLQKWKLRGDPRMLRAESLSERLSDGLLKAEAPKLTLVIANECYTSQANSVL
jgi:hypothetical protein